VQKTRAVRKTYLILAAAIALLAGCSSSKADSGSSSSGVDAAGVSQAKAIVAKFNKPPATIGQTVPLPKAPPAGKTLAFLVQEGVPSNALIGQAEGAAAKAIGWKYIEIPYDGSNPATLQSAFNSALIQHATAVTLTAIPTSVFGTSIVAAYQRAGVPIIVGAEAPVPPPSKEIYGDADGPTTFAQAAKVVAAWFVADSGGQGKAVIENVSSLTVIPIWVDAFQAEVKALCPKLCAVKVVNATLTEAVSPGQNGSLLATALERSPGYKYLLFSDATFASGINSALASAGLTGIKIGGSDFQVEQAAALRSHTQAAWTGVSLQQLAYGDVDYALRAVEGVPLTTNNNTLPIELMTSANIGNQTTFNQPANSLQQYEKIWKVPVTQ
jgi:ribose transport system substrate-binding protein